MAGEQISAPSALDIDGFTLQGQLYVPASAVHSSRAYYGVDEQTDGAGNHYAALAVADHIPITQASRSIFYAAGTPAGTQNLPMNPAPGAGVMQYVAGFMISSALATALQMFAVNLTGVAISMAVIWLAMQPSATDRVVVVFHTPIPASAAGTQIILQTTFTGTSTARVDATVWGFNRAV